MGSINSIPIVSQVKSFIQVINGHDAGARKTQEDFLRTWLVVSQINSLVHLIKGNNEEALKIQQQAEDEYLKLVESSPVVCHTVAVGSAITGDLDKTEDVDIAATKRKVIAAAAVACRVVNVGRAAAPCAGGAATELSFSCDGVKSAITGDNR